MSLEADINLDVMSYDQSLLHVEIKILNFFLNWSDFNQYDAVISQGDTMTVFCAAQAAFFNRTPFFHVEAGLRSYNREHPYPEEVIRQCVTRFAEVHFAPTQRAREILINEGISDEKVYVTGNTVIDSLRIFIEKGPQEDCEDIDSENTVLITIHRRENHGHRLKKILSAISILVEKYPNKKFVLPVHPNPNVKGVIYSYFSAFKNVVLCEPLEYPRLVQIMRKAQLILTDSGGIQEEAPTFGCPILVLRDTTERPEGIEAGFSKLVGVEEGMIVDKVSEILDQEYQATRLHHIKNPYGDGKASERILKTILDYLQ